MSDTRPLFCVKCHDIWLPRSSAVAGEWCRRCGSYTTTRSSHLGFVGGQGRSAAEVERTALGGAWIGLVAVLAAAALFIFKGCLI